MFAKLSVDKALMKAKLHSKRGELDEARKLYEAILNVFSKNVQYLMIQMVKDYIENMQKKRGKIMKLKKEC